MKNFIFTYPEKPIKHRNATPEDYARVNRSKIVKHSDKSRNRIEKISARDGWICTLCGKSIDPKITSGPWRATADHIIPKSLGGSDALYNRQLAHAICDNKRGNKLL
jgi:5-methylcytosine-specific restriction endonuclease McrA